VSEVTRRSFRGTGFGPDFHAVRRFLVRVNNTAPMASPEFLWSRWEWTFCLPFLDRERLGNVGIWESDGDVVGLATYEYGLGEAYLAVDPRFRARLLPELVEHAVTRLSDSGRIGIPVGEDEDDLAASLAARGFLPADRTEETVVRELDALPSHQLPDGYTITSLADGVDLRRLHRCLHLGFDHAEPVPEDESALLWRHRSISAPSLIPELNTVVVAPDGEYAAYCGSFHDPSTTYVQLEPVCTVPVHRGLGCGKAAVLEALARAARLEVRTAYVGSGQAFYARLGFRAFHRSRWWLLDPAGGSDAGRLH